MTGKEPHRNEDLAAAKETIGHVMGDREREAEGRAEREEIASEQTLEETVLDNVRGASGEKNA